MAAGGTVAINWDKLAIAWKGKRVVALGERRTGKTVLSSFPSTGSIPTEYNQTHAPKTLEGRRFRLQTLNLKIKQIRDFPGSTQTPGEALGVWKNAIDNADLVLYLVRVHLLKRQDRKTIRRVENDLKHIGSWLTQVKRKPCFFVVGTHCDLDQDHRDFQEQERLGDYVDAFRQIPAITNGAFACGGWTQVKVAAGSLQTPEAAEELVFQIFSKLPV
jgi:hypothetical protein